ncbi:MAG: serine hydrolase [Nitrospiraceae bacterium]|nr:serine hydrolase [Nitrospiraceae bacterium]
MSKARFIYAVLLCFALVTVLACGDSDSAPSQAGYSSAVATARSQIWKAINSGKCGSATAAIMVDGQVVFAEGFGMADREKGIPVDKSTLFNIGSISKVYVAAAIMLLVDDGAVELDKPVTVYLPDFRMADERYKQITVRMLLNHTSGMPGTEGVNSFAYTYDDKVKQDTLNTLARSHLKHDPGAMAVYCNDGFTLAEIIVERRSKMRYIDFLNERVFKPLTLNNTGLSVGDIKGKPAAAYYTPMGQRLPLEAISILGAGGLSSTAEDVSRFFVEAFAPDSKLFKPASLQEMKKNQPSAFWGKLRSPAMSCGLGWDMTSLPRYDAAGIQVLGKSGGTGNYSSMVYSVPDKKISVVVIGAGPESGAMTIALDVLDALLVEKGLIPKAEKPVAVPPASQKLPPDAASFAGYYANQTKLSQVVVDAEKNTVSLFSIKEQTKTLSSTLVYNDGYYYAGSGNRFYFLRSGSEIYLVGTSSIFGMDGITMQKVKTMENPKSMRIDMDGKTWLRRNVSAVESIMGVENHLVKSLLYKDLSGYVHFSGVKRIVSADFAGMPFDAVRDQTELTLVERNGTTWAWLSDMLYSPAENAAALKAGENSVTIGSEGYDEWFVAQENAVLGFSKPAQGRIVVFSPAHEMTYDSTTDAGDLYVAKGSYIECNGSAGDVFAVRARLTAADGKK